MSLYHLKVFQIFIAILTSIIIFVLIPFNEKALVTKVCLKHSLSGFYF